MNARSKHAGLNGLLFAAALAMGNCGSRNEDEVAGPDPAASNLATVAAASTPAPAPVYSQASPPVSQSSSQYSRYTQVSSQSTEVDDAGSYLDVSQAPPPLPEYKQPECPGDNYIWTPGSWSYASGGYYWVPGAWIVAPYIGALWTPPYWGYENLHYRWHRGYWGDHIGFYGGINYGFGYVGSGFYGGYWNRDVFMYNRSVANINVSTVHNVYSRGVVGNSIGGRISFNGGAGGTAALALPAEMMGLRERRMAPVGAQMQHMRESSLNRSQFATENHGRPGIAAANRPLATDYRVPAQRPMQEQIRQENRPGRGDNKEHDDNNGREDSNGRGENKGHGESNGRGRGRK